MSKSEVTRRDQLGITMFMRLMTPDAIKRFKAGPDVVEMRAMINVSKLFADEWIKANPEEPVVLNGSERMALSEVIVELSARVAADTCEDRELLRAVLNKLQNLTK